MAPLGAISVAITGIQNALVAIGGGSNPLLFPSNQDVSAIEVCAVDRFISVRVDAGTCLATFALEPGSFVNLVGPSGSGKTRFLHAFFDVLRHSSWSGVGTYLSDKALIIEGSVLENIKLGNPSIDDDEIMRLWAQLGRGGVDLERPPIVFPQEKCRRSQSVAPFCDVQTCSSSMKGSAQWTVIVRGARSKRFGQHVPRQS